MTGYIQIGELLFYRIHSGKLPVAWPVNKTLLQRECPRGMQEFNVYIHKTLENLVSVYISDNQRTWPDLVPIALWTIRSTTSFRTGYSPFTLLYGEDPVSMGMPEWGEIPESQNACEFYMKTKDNISMFRHLAADAVKIYEKEM